MILIFILFIAFVIILFLFLIPGYSANKRVIKTLHNACKECTNESVDEVICVLHNTDLIKLGRRRTFECCRASWKLLNSDQNISTEKKKELRKAFLANGINL